MDLTPSTLMKVVTLITMHDAPITTLPFPTENLKHRATPAPSLKSPQYRTPEIVLDSLDVGDGISGTNSPPQTFQLSTPSSPLPQLLLPALATHRKCVPDPTFLGVQSRYLEPLRRSSTRTLGFHTNAFTDQRSPHARQTPTPPFPDVDYEYPEDDTHVRGCFDLLHKSHYGLDKYVRQRDAEHGLFSGSFADGPSAGSYMSA
ncbi:hypothetical protein BD779DRAFT_1682550 [Infundibulicybe gibba]|nr:hypothetical protein BD779DRAFT_1682550 [Infundibulicybe gibba]